MFQSRSPNDQCLISSWLFNDFYTRVLSFGSHLIGQFWAISLNYTHCDHREPIHCKLTQNRTFITACLSVFAYLNTVKGFKTLDATESVLQNTKKVRNLHSIDTSDRCAFILFSWNIDSFQPVHRTPLGKLYYYLIHTRGEQTVRALEL